MTTRDTDLPTPAIYLPTESGEGATLLRLNPLATEGANLDDLLAGMTLMAATMMGEVDAELLPVLVWPSEVSEGVWQCQAAGTSLSVDEDTTYESEAAIADQLAGWVQASW